MAEMTFEDLRLILVDCAGEDDASEVRAADMDTAFADLGYDSLAILETVAQVKQRYGVAVPDDRFTTADTPRTFLTEVNSTVLKTA
jgi:act minimal PKS acyl carrier protein